MRNDFEGSMQLNGKFATEEEKQSWQKDEKDISNITHPFSGSERNRLFINSHADSFLDLSGISGVDSASDGRVSVWLDIDRDGRQDLAVVNSNRPLMQLYRNQTGEPSQNSASATNEPGNFIALRFVGGHNSFEPTQQFSNRDGWGARVTLQAGGLTITREHLCGQGFSGQNSATMLIGLGKADIIDSLAVVWPSGLQQTFADVPAGKLVTLHEHPQSAGHSAKTPQGITVSDYRKVPLKSSPTTKLPANSVGSPSFAKLRPTTLESQAGATTTNAKLSNSKLVVLTTMASWCTSCARHQPLLKTMSREFDTANVSFVGFPGDPEDPLEDFNGFVTRLSVDYPVVADPDTALRKTVESILKTGDGADVLPSTIVLDQRGNILGTHSGIPTASELRRHLSALKSGQTK